MHIPPPQYRIDHEILLEEPWCRLHSGKDLANWSKKDEIQWNQTNRQTEKYKFYIKAFDLIVENNIFGDYFEFGCHRGRTFRMALTEARHHNLTEMNFLAFDSFSGLPENMGEHGIGAKWGESKLVTSEQDFLLMMKEHGLYLDQILTYPGFYNESLSTVLQQNLKAEGKLAALICVDCDLYESAVPVFQFIEPFLHEGSVVYIDDYWSGYKSNPQKGVSAAFKEYELNSSWKFAEYLSIGVAGKSFICYK